jgi:hypothetical protein
MSAQRGPEKVLAVLAQADASFAETGDVMEALSWVGFAAKYGKPIPPHIGRWLHGAIVNYTTGSGTMDQALGLAVASPAQPRHKANHAAALRGALAEMMILHTLGATIPQAAAMVEARRGPGLAHATLTDRYRRRGVGRLALEDRPNIAREWSAGDVADLLDEYPDGALELAQAKKAIRAMYAKQRS